MPTAIFRVQLSDDLAAFVAEAVRDGLFESPDQLVAYAIAQVRTQIALGHTPDTVTSTSPTPPANETVDLTRKVFDGPAFMATLVDKLERRKADEKRPPK
jgi:Arc/MetJ-type ribon-helix-helix transcriptional regulator